MQTLIGSTAVEAIAFSPDRITLATGGQYGTTQLWNLGQDATISTGSNHLMCDTSAPLAVRHTLGF